MTGRNLDDSGRKWLLKTAHRNLWRVYGWYELDDLISDGLLCWQIVVSRYSVVNGKRSNKRHLMALFQRVYTNHIHKLSKKRTYDAVEDVTDDLPEVEHDASEADLRRLTSEQTGSLHALLNTILDKPELLARPHRRRIGGRRETTNEWLCGLIGLDPKQFDVEAKLRELLA